MKETEEQRIKRIVEMMGQQYTPELKNSLDSDEESTDHSMPSESDDSAEMEDDEEENTGSMMTKKKSLFSSIPNISIILGVGRKK